MVKCKWCDQDMKVADGCGGNEAVEYKDGTCLLSLPYEGDQERCHDCNAKFGHNHHPGCDTERCPKCGSQIISCGCEVVN